MKKEHFEYLDRLLEKKAIDDETIETYSQNAWLRFVEKHFATTRMMLDLYLKEEFLQIIDGEKEEYFLKVVRQLIEKQAITKEDIIEQTLTKYLLAIAQLKFEKHGRIIFVGMELYFLMKIIIPTKLLFAALFYPECRMKALKLLRLRITKTKFQSIVRMLHIPLGYEVNRRLQGSIRSRGKERLPDHLIPRNLIN